ncbi:MAG: hypothetical protein KDD59_14255, partial [Bdellovibrionales bacterium]|nr:hypothetical protein [Bdellovibrionales bacterium]
MMNRGVRIQLSLALSGIFLLILGACGRSGDSMQVPKDNPDAFTGGGGADISATGCEEITAYKKIQPILARRCTGCHHTFEKEPEQFLNRAKGGKNSNIYKFVFEKTPMEMPRAGSSQAAATTDAEREQIAEFVLGLEKDCNESKGVVASGTAQPQGIEVSAGSSQQQEKKALAIQDILNPEMKTVLTTCTGCHGSYGVASDPEAPHLAGQNAEYIVSQLEQFALPVEDSSHRPGGVMNFMVSSLTPENRE